MNSSNTSTAIKVCLDTNILVSALIFGGKPEEILDLAARNEIVVLSSPGILTELKQVLAKKFKWSEIEIKQSLKALTQTLTLITPQHRINTIKYSPDNRILECAVEGDATYIITDDKKHLLPLKKFEGIKIITAIDFLRIIQRN